MFSGVNRDRTRIILVRARRNVVRPGRHLLDASAKLARGDIGDGLELQVIAAVVLGGVSVFGGIGSLYGVVAGVLLIGALSSALRLVGVTAEVIKIITGVLLIGSVVAASMIASFRTEEESDHGVGPDDADRANPPGLAQHHLEGLTQSLPVTTERNPMKYMKSAAASRLLPCYW